MWFRSEVRKSFAGWLRVHQCIASAFWMDALGIPQHAEAWLFTGPGSSCAGHAALRGACSREDKSPLCHPNTLMTQAGAVSELKWPLEAAAKLCQQLEEQLAAWLCSGTIAMNV